MSDNKIDRFKKVGLIGCLNTKCHKTGCRNLETRCKDCGEVVNTSVLSLNDENKQSSHQDIIEISKKEANSAWIDREVKFPVADRILCCAGNKIFICELIESKCGDFYYSTDTEHIEFQNMPEWTHWMPLPKPPREHGMD